MWLHLSGEAAEQKLAYVKYAFPLPFTKCGVRIECEGEQNVENADTTDELSPLSFSKLFV